MMHVPRPYERYRHFKGNLYQVITLAEHTETGEQMVVYQALYGEYKVYTRPLSSFMEKLDKVKYPHADQEWRFRLQTDGQVPEPIIGAAEQEEEPEQTEEPGEADIPVDPMVLDFLDADSHGERLNILAGLHHRMTDEMITTMAVALDIELPEGDLESRYQGLKNCLQTLERYECNRLR